MSTTRLSLVMVMVMIATLGVACSETDGTPPAPPLVDPARSPTSLDRQVLRGTAEFGAAVEISGAVSVAPATIAADPYTARWEATVELAAGDNTIAVIAVDAAGNASAPTQLTITREPAHAESLAIRLNRTLLTADDATVVVHITAGNDEPVDLTGIEYVVAVEGYPKAIPPVTVLADAAGGADAIVTGLDAAGLGTIVVTATTSPGLRASADFLVDEGLPASLDLLLSDGVLPPADALAVPAGTPVFASIDVQDAALNDILDAPVALFTDAPDALVIGNQIADLTVAGSWRVVGVVGGTLLSDVATLTVAVGPPALVTIDPASSAARAGDQVTFTVAVTDEFGNQILPASFTLTTDAPAGSTTFTAPASYSFCAPGAWTVTAEAGLGGPTASASVVVSPGAAVAVTLATTPGPAVITAGEPVAFTTATVDGCGNATSDLVVVTTNAPGAIVGAGTVAGLTEAGTWLLVARVADSALVDDAPIVVGADAATTMVSLFLTSHGTNAGLPIGYAVTAVDGFGNPVAGTPSITTSDPGATVDSLAQTIVFATPGTQTVTASLGGASDADFVVVTFFDAAAPTVSITSPPAGTVVAPGANVTVVVSAADDAALAELLLQATGEATFFETRLAPGGTTATTATFVVNVPGGARVGPIDLIAQAVDTSGNRTSTPILTIQVDPAAGITTIGGFTTTTLSIADLLASPRGLAVRGTTVYVANGGSSSVIQLDGTTGAQATFTPALGAAPQDLEYTATNDRFFVSETGPNRLQRIDTVGAATTFTTAFGQQLGIVASGADIFTVSDDDRVRRFNPASTPLATPSCTLDLGGAGGFPGLGGGGRGLAVDAAGGIVVTEDNADAIWRVAPGFACPSTPAASFVAGGADVNQPRDVILAASGFLYYVNRGDGRLMRIDLSSCGAGGCAVTTIASGFNAPWGLAFSGGALLISDEADDVIYRMTGPF